jgi:hypothetical protein
MRRLWQPTGTGDVAFDILKSIPALQTADMVR